MIQLRTFDHHRAMAVIANLDPHDLLEAEAIRGAQATHLAIFADWCAIEGARLASWCAVTAEGTPFAVIALAHTGQSGVASAAMLARDHARYRRPLVEVARRIRDGMPIFCAEAGIHRIEARAWARHPRASRFLTLTGFTHEADLPGFGPSGRETFRQFAWVPAHHIPRGHPHVHV